MAFSDSQVSDMSCVRDMRVKVGGQDLEVRQNVMAPERQRSSRAQVGAEEGAIQMLPIPPTIPPPLSWVLSECGHLVVCKTLNC